MAFLRLLAILVVLTVVVSALIYLLTGNRSYLQFGIRVFKYGMLFGALIVGYVFIERLIGA